LTELDVKVELKGYHLYKRPVAIIRLPSNFRTLSSTIMGGGYIETDTLFIFEVPLGYDERDPEGDLEKVCREYGLGPPCVGFMTAADVRKVITVTKETVNGVTAVTVATAGTTNALVAGEQISQDILDSLNKRKAGTINIITAVDVPLEDCGMANAIMTMTEAKAAALKDVGLNATGTTSDAVAICCPPGKGGKYAGTATDVGVAVARSVRAAVAGSVRKWTNGKKGPAKDFMSRLEEMGIGEAEMWEAAAGLYVPDPSWGEEMIREKFRKHLRVLRKDINVNAMVFAAINMEEMGCRDEMYGLDRGRYFQDPVHLVADELLGIALAEYIAGTKGLFEYVRYDKKKPGVLGTLGPFLDDIVASLIGSIMSRIYTELLEGEDKLGS